MREANTFLTTSSSDWLVLPPPSAMDMSTGSAFFLCVHHSSAVMAGMSAWVSGYRSSCTSRRR